MSEADEEQAHELFRDMTEPRNPFQIRLPYNELMKCHDLHLMVGNLTNEEAHLLADALSEWLIEGSTHGWKARVS